MNFVLKISIQSNNNVYRFQYVVERISDKCSARLLVNGSVAMSGEQVLKSHETIPQFARLHLGGIPVAFSHQFPQIVLGFVGCMSLLKVWQIILNRHYLIEYYFKCIFIQGERFGARLRSRFRRSSSNRGMQFLFVFIKSM